MSARKPLLVLPMLFLCASAASAQTLPVDPGRTALPAAPSGGGATASRPVNGDVERDVSPELFAVAADPAQRKYRVRLMGGLLTGYGDAGLALGGGVGLRPFDNERIELAFDGIYGHTSQAYFDDRYSTSVLAFGGSLLYNFHTAGGRIVPYAGGGLVISHASLQVSLSDVFEGAVAGTFATLQLVAGVEKPLSDKRAFRAELRAGTASFGGSLLLLGGLSFH